MREGDANSRKALAGSCFPHFCSLSGLFQGKMGKSLTVSCARIWPPLAFHCIYSMDSENSKACFFFRFTSGFPFRKHIRITLAHSSPVAPRREGEDWYAANGAWMAASLFPWAFRSFVLQYEFHFQAGTHQSPSPDSLPWRATRGWLTPTSGANGIVRSFQAEVSKVPLPKPTRSSETTDPLPWNVLIMTTATAR